VGCELARVDANANDTNHQSKSLFMPKVFLTCARRFLEARWSLGVFGTVSVSSPWKFSWDSSVTCFFSDFSW